jgi:hypothetical protein
MVVGFNHNFRYKGEVYHIQTEDSGMKNPNIVTLLYQGGTILGSKKTSYADIAKINNLDQVVEELMKEQHKEMLRRLKTGEFDEVIKSFQFGRKVVPRVLQEEKVSVPQIDEKLAAVAIEPVAAAVVAPRPAPEVAPGAPSPAEPAEKTPSSVVELSLDEVILSYLMGDGK